MELAAHDAYGTWTNWYGNMSCNAFVSDPHTEESVCAAIRLARRRGHTIRLAGTGHSNVPLIPNSGTVLTTDALQGVLSHDSGTSTVTIAGGTKIRTLGDKLWDLGLSLTNQGDIDTQSIAGALATGTHGTGQGLTNLSARATSFRIVDANGDLRVIDENSENQLRAARVSLGMLGAVTAVTLKVSPAYMLHEWAALMPYEQVAEIEEHMNTTYRHFGYFCSQNPQAGARFMALDAEQVAAMSTICFVRVFDTEPIDAGELEKYTVRRRHDRAYRIFAEDYPPEFDEMEYMIPVADGRACFEELTDRAGPYFRATGIPSEVRVVAGDDSYLSEFQGGARRAISVAGIMHQDNRDFFRACHDVFARFGGRPHWAKASFLTQESVRDLYPLYEDFVAVRRDFDPDGVFLNNHLRPLFT